MPWHSHVSLTHTKDNLMTNIPYSSHDSECLDAASVKSNQNQSDKLTIYSANTAFQFMPQTTRNGFYTLGIEAALKGEGNQYQWNDKLTCQLTDRELPAFIAVTMGLLKIATWKNRGPHNKSLQLKHQDVNLFLKVTQRDLYVQGPIESFDTFHLAAMGLSQLSRNYPGLTSDSVLAMLKSVIGNMGQAKYKQWLAQRPSQKALK